MKTGAVILFEVKVPMADRSENVLASELVAQATGIADTLRPVIAQAIANETTAVSVSVLSVQARVG